MTRRSRSPKPQARAAIGCCRTVMEYFDSDRPNSPELPLKRFEIGTEAGWELREDISRCVDGSKVLFFLSFCTEDDTSCGRRSRGRSGSLERPWAAA